MIIISLILATLIGGALYRLRGGWLKTLTGIGSTQVCRLVWSAPTAALMCWQVGGPWWLAAALVVTVFASIALFGHGAHMVFGRDAYFIHVTNGQTELLTRGWLQKLFGGFPTTLWRDWRVDLFNMVGMSAIGLVRNALAVAPAAIVAPLPAALYAATGLAHGPLYWLGWKVTPDIRAAEVLVGAVSWVSIVLIFGRPII